MTNVSEHDDNKEKYLVGIFLATAIATLLYIPVAVYQGFIFNAVIQGITVPLFLFSAWYIRKKEVDLVYPSLAIFTFSFFLGVTYTVLAEQKALYWFFMFPPAILFTLTLNPGILWVTISYLILIPLLLYMNIKTAFPAVDAINFIMGYSFSFFSAFFIEKSRSSNIKLIQELKSRQDRLIQQEKKAIIGDLAAGFAHEVKNQLTPITFLELNEDDLPDETKKHYSYILSGRDRIIDLIDEVRALVRNEDVNYIKREERLDFVVREAIAFIRMDRSLEQVPIEINDNFHSGISVNKNKMIQVLLNLLRNSTQALKSKDGGKIEINLYPENGKAVIEVRDNGCGISEQKLEKIWLPFYTTKGNEGTGIGLDVCRKIIEGHGGTISCSSVVNNGTVFKISLPVSSKTPGNFVSG